MKKLYKVTLNEQTIQTTEIVLEALALALNIYKASNEPMTIEVTEDDKMIVTFIRRSDNE